MKGQETNDANNLLRYREQILETGTQLMEYIQNSTQKLEVLNDRTNRIQDEINKLLIEKRVMSEKINKINTTINVTIKECLIEICNYLEERDKKDNKNIQPPKFY